METIKVTATVPKPVHATLSRIAKEHQITIGALATHGVLQFTKQIDKGGLLHKFPRDGRTVTGKNGKTRRAK